MPNSRSRVWAASVRRQYWTPYSAGERSRWSLRRWPMPDRCSTSSIIPAFWRRECGPGNEGISVAKRVLVVDDEPEIGEILEGYLRSESFDPVVATTVA